MTLTQFVQLTITLGHLDKHWTYLCHIRVLLGPDKAASNCLLGAIKDASNCLLGAIKDTQISANKGPAINCENML